MGDDAVMVMSDAVDPARPGWEWSRRRASVGGRSVTVTDDYLTTVDGEFPTGNGAC
jgi:hypothetical protein